MSRFIEGESRNQATLFTEALDDYITEENPVRVVDIFVNELDLSKLGFTTIPAWTGRPAYHPASMLKLFIYGYLNKIQSSRRLEKEAGRNVELMWLIQRLAPDFKTIADFRRDNTQPIKSVCREFVQLCQKLELFSEAIVAIDGSKFKAVNARDRNFSKTKIKKRLKQIEKSIDDYLSQIESADRQDEQTAKLRTERLEGKIAKLREEVKQLNEIDQQLDKQTDKQLSLTDPDARSIATAGKGIVGYNVQTAVETKHHLIVAHEVTNDVTDKGQLFNMASKAQQAMDTETLEVLTDRGYFNSLEIKACDEAGIRTYLPKPQTSGNQSKGYFGRRDFIYIPEDDEYECPASERAEYRFSREESGKVMKRYWSKSCVSCSLKPKCTSGRERRIVRWEHEDILDQLESRMDHNPRAMITRRSTVEHPFGTIKSWLTHNNHFLVKTLDRVGAEMSLHVLAYNMKRVINILGTSKLIAAMQE